MLRNRRFNPDQIIIEKDIEFGYYCIIIDDEFEELKKENEQLKQNANKIAVKNLQEIMNYMTDNGSDYCEIRKSTSEHAPDMPYAWFNYVAFRRKINAILAELKGELI